MHAGAEAAKKLGKIAAASDFILQMMALAQRAHRAEFIKLATAELMKLASDSKDPYVLGNAAMAKADDLLERQQLEAAEHHYEVAARYYVDAEDRNSPSADIDADEVKQESRRDTKRMLGLAYKQLGFVNDKAGKHGRAISFYERALAQLAQTDDGINEGAILHGIANCAADAGDYDKALSAYCAAAEHFHSIGMSEYLSNSLSELGYLLVEWTPSKPVGFLLSKERLATGLIDAAQQAMRVFNASRNEWSSRHGMETIRKMLGMLALLSFTEHNRLLGDWAKRLRNDIMRPSLKQLDQGNRNGSDQLMLMYLDVTLALAGTVSSSEQPQGQGPTASLQEIEHLAMLCYQFLEWGWDAFRPFNWLATYLRRHRGVRDISAGSLLGAAEDVAEGGEFSVTGLR